MKVFSCFWIGFLAAMGFAGCKSDSLVSAGAQESAQARVVVTERVEMPAALRSTGTLHAYESSTLSAQVLGRVEKVLVREGDTVRAGQTVVVLDDATLRSTADQAKSGVTAAEQQEAAAEANADLAASTLARYKQLEAKRSVSPQEMDEVTRRAEAAAAEVAALKAQTNAIRAQQTGASAMLGYSRIVAPFAGIVTARMIDPGTMAAPGVPLVQIDSAGPLELNTPIPESAIAGLRKNMKLDVSVDSINGQSFPGLVSEIVPAADPATHSFLVKISLPSSKLLRAGLTASASVPAGSKQVVLAPLSAIVMRGSLATVLLLDSSSIAQLRYLTLGEGHGDKVEILSGLNGGEKLVDSPGDRDLAGKRIEKLSVGVQP